ncbi:glycoside hydrolase family 99-like domain-containing protein [Paenibacillus hodogayensis]|uniref:Glycoside hydrolase family 99-like domain-containing protein n=1 Tax=Paenibacillus hodogayensis TaxID=279208 RepID=A0ABV5VPD8_9BACL
MKPRSSIQVAAYYFPNYHPDPRNAKWHGAGWTEWELVRKATPRFPGHVQPKEPLWGYEDESDPLVMGNKIDAAASHGIDAFLFDWYWYEDGPFLQRALEQGFLKAANNDKLKFALMWANHDWQDIHPATRSRPYKTLASGAVSKNAFLAACEHIVHTYFSHPSYLRVDGKLYFSVYELMSLVAGLGSIDETREALGQFRDMVRQAGLGELHLNAVVWGVQLLPGEKEVTNPAHMLRTLGFDSVASYVWIHHHKLETFPETRYATIREKSKQTMETLSGQYDLPYYPNVTMGWDSSPRTIQSDRFDNLGYPYMPLLGDNTPEQFELALREAKAFLERRNDAGTVLCTINAWNEWTEGSYLEPDTVHGTAYLQAVRNVFGTERSGCGIY